MLRTLMLAHAARRALFSHPLRSSSALSALTAPSPSWWNRAGGCERSLPGSVCRAMFATLGAVDSGGLKRKMAKTVGTHNGTFHCDEALGCFMIRLTDKFADAEIVRTRDQKVLETLDAVLDVGGVYDPETDRFDHHQRGFDQNFGRGFVTKLSSAGLVYKHYGQEILAKELGLKTDHPDVQRVFLAVYKSFMEAIDGIDNGINLYDTDKLPRYANDTHLSARVGRLNPDWMDEQTSEAEDEAFRKAMSLTGGEFLESVRYYAKSWLPARSIVADCIADRKEADSSGEIMILKHYCPWKTHLAELEEELKIEPTIKYVLYEDGRSKGWRVQAVSVSAGSFESRLPLPAVWRGLRDDELSRESGIDGGIIENSHQLFLTSRLRHATTQSAGRISPLRQSGLVSWSPNRLLKRMDHHESKLSSSSTDNIRCYTAVFYVLALTGLRWNRDTYQLPARVAKGPRILAWNAGTATRLCPILQLKFCFCPSPAANRAVWRIIAWSCSLLDSKLWVSCMPNILLQISERCSTQPMMQRMVLVWPWFGLRRGTNISS